MIGATMSLNEYHDAAQQAARRAAVVLEDWRARFQVREKGRFDLVTDADLASQQIIQEYLSGRFPDHAFLGEENEVTDQPSEVGSRKLDSEIANTDLRPPTSDFRPPTAPAPHDAPPTWIIDPIDGTTNYVHDCPLYCVSIGLQIAGELVVGAVLDPSRNE